MDINQVEKNIQKYEDMISNNHTEIEKLKKQYGIIESNNDELELGFKFERKRD